MDIKMVNLLEIVVKEVKNQMETNGQVFSYDDIDWNWMREQYKIAIELQRQNESAETKAKYRLWLGEDKRSL